MKVSHSNTMSDFPFCLTISVCVCGGGALPPAVVMVMINDTVLKVSTFVFVVRQHTAGGGGGGGGVGGQADLFTGLKKDMRRKAAPEDSLRVGVFDKGVSVTTRSRCFHLDTYYKHDTLGP